MVGEVFSLNAEGSRATSVVELEDRRITVPTWERQDGFGDGDK